jgi:hypothetical protein
MNMRKLVLYKMVQAALASEVIRMLCSLISITKYCLLSAINDKWIRIYAERNDLIVLVSSLLAITPMLLTSRIITLFNNQSAGIYHHFTLDDKKFIHAMRSFKDVRIFVGILWLILTTNCCKLIEPEMDCREQVNSILCIFNIRLLT